MRLFQIYFSPTGGTKKVLDLISKNWDYEKIEIDLSDPTRDDSNDRIGKEDLCVVAVPVFGGRAPQVALSNIQRLNGNGARTILIAVYGNRAYEDALLELRDTMRLAGFCCVAGIAAVAEHSIMRQFGAGRPDFEDEEQFATFSEKIKEVMSYTGCRMELNVPGNYPYKEYKAIPMIPETDQGCIKCGLCAEKCPAEAIPKENPVLTEQGKCISCMRCVAICPEKARHADASMIGALSKRLEKVCSGRKGNELFLAKA